MKKTIYIPLVLICLSASSGLYSQTQHTCFSSKTTINGTIEKTLITLMSDGKTVEADVQKELTQGSNASARSWEMQGTIEGDKITFIVPQGTVDMFDNDVNSIKGPKLIEHWTLKNDQLIIDKNILQVVNCK